MFCVFLYGYAPTHSSTFSGRVIVKRVPFPGVDATSIFPLKRSTIVRQMASPSPVPCLKASPL